MIKVVCLADTHCSQHELVVPVGDIVIHAGDALCDGTAGELKVFFDWFATLPHPVKIFVPGNHDEILYWEEAKARALLPKGVCLLIGEYLTVDGYIEIFGAPWTPGAAERLGDKPTATAFCLPDTLRVEALGNAPTALDILICHSPPRHLINLNGDPLVIAEGDLLIDDLILRTRPRLVVCGHVHKARGVYKIDYKDGTHCIVVNAACMGANLETLQPIAVEI